MQQRASSGTSKIIYLLAAYIFVIHLGVAIHYKQVGGFNITQVMRDTGGMTSGVWDFYWQFIPERLIRNKFTESIWHLHAQPPFYNLYGAVYIKLLYPNYYEYIHDANIVIGALLSAAVCMILHHVTRSEALAFVIGLLLAFNPALFLYEAFLLYELMCAFLIVVCILCLSAFSVTRTWRYLVYFIFFVNVLMLTRSLYHVVILLVLIPLVCILARQAWRRVLFASLLISGLTVGWYAKNQAMYGFFGASSWTGINLWKVIFEEAGWDGLKALQARGVIDRFAAEMGPFFYVTDYIKWGYNKSSKVELISGNNYHNINVPAISRRYAESALRVIAAKPQLYLRSALESYKLYSQPATAYNWIAPNAARMERHNRIYTQYFEGQALLNALGVGWMGSVFFVLLPLTLVVYSVMLIRACGLSRQRWVSAIRGDPALLFMAFMIAYTAIAGCFFERGENVRFKFMVEQVMWMFLVCLVYRFSRKGGSASPSRTASR